MLSKQNRKMGRRNCRFPSSSLPAQPRVQQQERTKCQRVCRLGSKCPKRLDDLFGVGKRAVTRTCELSGP